MEGRVMKKNFLKKQCSECGKKLALIGGYRHPTLGSNNCVCYDCFEKIDKSESHYSNFIMNSLYPKQHGPVCYVLISAAPTFEKKY